VVADTHVDRAFPDRGADRIGTKLGDRAVHLYLVLDIMLIRLGQTWETRARVTPYAVLCGSVHNEGDLPLAVFISPQPSNSFHRSRREHDACHRRQWYRPR
jgi:hypothetical protein